MDEVENHVTPLARALIKAFERKTVAHDDKTLSVNRVVSEVATWYEKLRTAMDYREDEVVLRGAIERILKRRLLLGGNGRTVALPLVRELLWARYFKEGTVPEAILEHVSSAIDLYLTLRQKVQEQKVLDESTLSEWVMQLMSAEIEHILNPNNPKDTMSNFFFQVMKDKVVIEDDSPETRDAQVFVAVRRAFAKDDIAFLRYNLFRLYFGPLTHENVEGIAANFKTGYNEIQKQLKYPLKEKIYTYIRRQAPVFFILQDVLSQHADNIEDILADEEELAKAVYAACEARYRNIGAKIRRAIVRSVIFILFTKAVFALVVEGTYERLLYGKVLWGSIILNTTIPPLIMVVVGFLIKTPGIENSRRILQRIKMVLYEKDPSLVPPLVLSVAKRKTRTNMEVIFGILWFLGFVLTFGGLWWLLGKVHFTYISRFVFLFFITIISFISYRINQTAHMYTVEDKQSLSAPLFDILFLPIVRVGRRLTEGISQINVVLFIFDFLFEAPFKGLFAFFEQWFVYLHAKREDLE